MNALYHRAVDGVRLGDIWLLAMQHGEGAPAATTGREHHQRDFEQFDSPYEQRLFVFVGELARRCREQEKGQYEQSGGDISKLRVIHPGDKHAKPDIPILIGKNSQPIVEAMNNVEKKRHEASRQDC